jgi:hypothetical protein
VDAINLKFAVEKKTVKSFPRIQQYKTGIKFAGDGAIAKYIFLNRCSM